MANSESMHICYGKTGFNGTPSLIQHVPQRALKVVGQRREGHQLPLPCVTHAEVLLQEELGLPVNADVPLLAFIGRLDSQKGADLILQAAPWIVEQVSLPHAPLRRVPSPSVKLLLLAATHTTGCGEPLPVQYALQDQQQRSRTC